MTKTRFSQTGSHIFLLLFLKMHITCQHNFPICFAIDERVSYVLFCKCKQEVTQASEQSLRLAFHPSVLSGDQMFMDYLC